MAEYTTSIEIDARPEVVFEYLTTNAGMTAWMGQHASLDARPGGQFAVDIAGYAVRGSYLHVEPPTRVVVSWGIIGTPDLAAGSTTVEFRLSPTERGTLVELTHSELPDTALAGHRDGWEHFMPRLVIAASGGDAGADHWRPMGALTSTEREKESTMTHNPAQTIVREYHDAWTSGDVDKAMALVADDITCRAPGADLTGKDAYREYIAGFAPMLTGIGDIAAFEDGERVALFYYPQTAATSIAPAGECFTIRGGKIAESVLVFDRLSFGPPADQ